MIDNAIALEQGKIKTFWDLKHIKGVHPMDVKFYFTQICIVVDILCTKYIDKSAKKATRKDWQWDSIRTTQEKGILSLGAHQGSPYNRCQILLYTYLHSGWYLMHKIHWQKCKQAIRVNWQWDSIITRQEKGILRLEAHQGSPSNGCGILIYTDLHSGWYPMHKIHWQKC